MEKLELLRQWIDESDNIVFFGGAGVSTESGIPDFRSVDGLYHLKYKYPPETILGHSFFVRRPEDFYEFYRDKLLAPEARPNPAHLKLAQWEAEGKLKAVITQNIDGLHQMAGSREVLELHGSVHRCYCSKCHKAYDEAYVNSGEGVPRCDCGGVVRPDVVLYEEPLDESIMSKAIRYIRNADVLIVGGTSLNVYPAAGLLYYYRGQKLVLINRSSTPANAQANLVIHGKIGEVFSQL
ncbi:MAG: NAD-dependent protein deacylase [Oscillospiraceae bacterium]|nr:NAD-dependent protein deacylase [Oscillospiraceae bacterium]